MSTEQKVTPGHTNPDAITGAPASHPGGTAIGSASGAAAGAALGSIGGPVGAIIGGVAGAIVGAGIGHEAGEWNDPSDRTYWEKEYKTRPYYRDDAPYDRDVDPAYRYGDTMAVNHVAKSPDNLAAFSSQEGKARTDWEKQRGESKLTYEQARAPMMDAYDRKVRQHKESL